MSEGITSYQADRIIRALDRIANALEKANKETEIQYISVYNTGSGVYSPSKKVTDATNGN